MEFYNHELLLDTKVSPLQLFTNRKGKKMLLQSKDLSGHYHLNKVIKQHYY